MTTLIKICPQCNVQFQRPSNYAHQICCSPSCASKLKYGTWKKQGKKISNFHKKLNAHTAPTEHPTTLDIAWAAGIYEGEGACRGSNNGAVQIHVGQKDRWLCDKLRAFFGGGVCATTNIGSPFYNWQLSGARARGFLMTIYCLQSPRRQEQIRKALKLGEYNAPIRPTQQAA